MLSALETSEVRACACIHAKIVCPKRQDTEPFTFSDVYNKDPFCRSHRHSPSSLSDMSPSPNLHITD